MEEYTVSELSNNIKNVLDGRFKNVTVKVVGEISNISIRGNTTWLTLKDNTSSLDTVFWNILDNKLGDNVEILGNVNYWNKKSQIKFIGSDIKLFGVGDIYREYEELKIKYEKAGYFNNRRPLPKSVRNIGVVTSGDGAALHDFLYVMKKNNFSGNVYVYDCIVQGPKCPLNVSNGIKFFNKSFSVNNIQEQNIDIIVVTRGGGSLEDLMGFSHKKVIESIYKSKKYIISAVGHEVDNMLSDSVANYRAPTPSIAGEVVASINITKTLVDIDNKICNIKDRLLQELYKYKNSIVEIKNSIVEPTDILNNRLDGLCERAYKHIKNMIHEYRKRIHNITDILNSNNPENILKQGFIVLTNDNNNIIYNISDILNNKIKLIHSSGTYDVTIKKRTKRKKKKEKEIII